MKYLDNLWSSLDPGEGLYWALEKAGAVQKLVDDALVERFVHEPPQDTRAWLRAWALRNAADVVDDVDWDMLRLRHRSAGGARLADVSELLHVRSAGFHPGAVPEHPRIRCVTGRGVAGVVVRQAIARPRACRRRRRPSHRRRLVKTYWPLARSMRAGASDNSSFHKGSLTMESQQITVANRTNETRFTPTPEDGAAQALASCRRMADAADAAIDQAYSGDAEAFLAANKQEGGQ